MLNALCTGSKNSEPSYAAVPLNATSAFDAMLFSAPCQHWNVPVWATSPLNLLKRIRLNQPTMENAMANQQYASCIEACNSCADTCDFCAASCLQEQDVKMMARCIALDMDCAQICRMAAAYMARGSEFAKAICQQCADICQACGDECARHQMQHCQDCAAACKRCADECRRMAAA